MSVVFDYEGIIQLIEADAFPAHVLDEWKTTLGNEQARIYARLLDVIPSETAFKDKIADASSDAWETFVNPNWPDADVIKMKQRVKLARAYNAWKTGVDNAFGEGGYFADRVMAKADKFKMARYVLSIVGCKSDPDIMWRAGTKAVKFFVGDKRILRYMDSTLDTYSGEPVMAVKAAFGKRFQALVLGRLVQGFVMAMFAHEGGLTSLRDSIISSVNSDMDDILTAALKADYAAPPTSYLHLVYTASTDTWSVKAHLETAA